MATNEDARDLQVLTGKLQGLLSEAFYADQYGTYREGREEIRAEAVALLQEAALAERNRILSLLDDWDTFFNRHHFADGRNWCGQISHIIDGMRQPPESRYGQSEPATNPWSAEFAWGTPEAGGENQP